MYNRIHMAHDKKGIPIIGGMIGFLDTEDINYAIPALVIGLFIVVVVLSFIGVSQSKMITFIFILSPLWLPYLTFHLFFEKWLEMVGKKFRLKSGRTIFEIKLPPEVFKSPEAMEFVFTQIWNQASPDNLWETYIDGKRPPNYTFELVSRGGDVHFYATIPNKFTGGFVDNMYAQYPGVEVIKQEVDYTAEVPSDFGDFKEWSAICFHFNKKNDEELPIKTYIDFGMDKLPKEEQKVDPMTPMLEMLGAIDPHRQIWIQFIVRGHRKRNFKNGQLHAEGTWEKRIQAKIDKLMGRDKDKKAEIEFEGMVKLTTGERDLVDSMERQAGKAPFEFACRLFYLSKKPGDYDGGLYSKFIRNFAATENRIGNGLGVNWRTDFNYNWFSDPFAKIRPKLKKEELHLYKTRQWFKHFKVMSAEEMATIFHLPGTVAFTPTLNRVPSTRGEAPNNLPTGNLPT